MIQFNNKNMGAVKAIADKIKSIREKRGLTQEQLSQKAGISLDQLIAIENNEATTAVDLLVVIAKELGVQLGAIVDVKQDLGPVVCRAKDQALKEHKEEAPASHKHMHYKSLAGYKSDRHIEPYMISLDACGEKDFILSSHHGEEFLFVIEGAVEINYGEEHYRLEKGDSIFYDSIVEHHVSADKEVGAQILAIVYTPF